MSKRILLVLVVLLLSSMYIGCSKPYDAKVIDQSEVDSPSQQERATPAAGGGKALSDRQW